MGVIVSDNFSREKMEKFLNKTENNYNDKYENENRAYRHLVKADALRLKNYFWESIEEYLNSLSYDSKNIDTYVGLGYSYKQIGYVKSAVNAFNQAKKLSPFLKELYFEAGCCYCIDQNFIKAIAEYKKALKINPDFLEARFNLAFAYELNDQNALAVEEYKKIIEKNPEHIKSYNNLGSIYMKLELYKEAIKIFKETLKRSPEYSRAYLGVAICFDKLKDCNIALRYYKKYLKQNPKSENLSYILDRLNELSKGKVLSRNSHLMLVS